MEVESSSSNGGAGNSTSSRFSWSSILTAVAYLANVILSYGVGVGGWFGTPTNGDLSRKYQTLVTPASTAFAIWGVIFIWEFVFVVAQFVRPASNALRVWYSISCAFQVAWSFVFAFEQLVAALVLMLGIWGSLLGVLAVRERNVANNNDTNLLDKNPWLARVPFAIHFGWITAASAVSVNVVVVGRNASGPVEVAAAIISLSLLLVIALFLSSKGNYIIAGVLAWATYWVFRELQSPQESIQDQFGEDVTSGIGYSALVLSCLTLLAIAVFLTIRLACRRGKKAKESSNNETTSLSQAFVPIDDKQAV